MPATYLKKIPKALTVLRLLLVPLFWVLFWKGQALRMLTLSVFILAAMTDLLDGYLARRWQAISDFGKLMDPLADKLMVMVALLCFVLEKTVPWWFLGLVLARELTMMAGAYYMLKHDIVVYSKWPGKVAAGLFYLAVLTTFIPGVWPYNLCVLTLAVLVMLLSFVGYAKDCVLALKKAAKAAVLSDSALTNTPDRVQ